MKRNQGKSLRVTMSKEKNKEATLGFPGGAVVGSPPANAGDTGSSPGPGGSHMPRSDKARAPQLLKPTRLEPVLCSRGGHHHEKPVHRGKE